MHVITLEFQKMFYTILFSAMCFIYKSLWFYWPSMLLPKIGCPCMVFSVASLFSGEFTSGSDVWFWLCLGVWLCLSVFLGLWILVSKLTVGPAVSFQNKMCLWGDIFSVDCFLHYSVYVLACFKGTCKEWYVIVFNGCFQLKCVCFLNLKKSH